MDIDEFFDELYAGDERYWWRNGVRYSADPDLYPTSLLTQMTLRLLSGRPAGRALDLGAGEGSDAIRLALLGYHVTAVEISKIGADKIRRFADKEGVDLKVEVGDVRKYQPDGEFDVIICNGVLHYIQDKHAVIQKMKSATVPGGINVVSAWSDFTPVPECHRRVPVFCDQEDGTIRGLYGGWHKVVLYFERGKKEFSHDGMPPHIHSHVKMIAVKPDS
jgi:SAM-dependent methyltransferase